MIIALLLLLLNLFVSSSHKLFLLYKSFFHCNDGVIIVIYRDHLIVSQPVPNLVAAAKDYATVSVFLHNIFAF